MKGEGLSVTGADVDEAEEALESKAPAPAPTTTGPIGDRLQPSPAQLRACRQSYAKDLARARARIESLRESVKSCHQSARRPSTFLGSVDCSSVEGSLRSAQDALRNLQARRP